MYSQQANAKRERRVRESFTVFTHAHIIMVTAQARKPAAANQLIAYEERNTDISDPKRILCNTPIPTSVVHAAVRVIDASA